MTIPDPTVPFVAATAALGGAGVAKLFRPGDTARALRLAGFPVGQTLVRVGSAAEVVVAVVAFLAPRAVGGALVAAAYLGFAGFIALALTRGWALASCGCFGRPDTPPTRAHALLNLGAAAAAVWWAVAGSAHTGVAAWGRLVNHSPWHGGPLVLVTAVVMGLAYIGWTNPVAAARR
jgi:hypothetical protein